MSEASMIKHQGHDELPMVLRIHPHITGIMGICKEAAYDLANRKDFPAIRIGRSIRVPRDAFLKWLEKEAAGERHAI